MGREERERGRGREGERERTRGVEWEKETKVTNHCTFRLSSRPGPVFTIVI